MILAHLLSVRKTNDSIAPFSHVKHAYWLRLNAMTSGHVVDALLEVYFAKMARQTVDLHYLHTVEQRMKSQAVGNLSTEC